MVLLKTAASVCALMCLLAVSAPAPAQSGGGGRLKLEVELNRTKAAPRLASAKAKYENRGNRSKLSVEGEDLTGLDGQSVTVLVGGRNVGSTGISAGGFDLNLDTLLGDTVPAVSPGTAVVVKVGGTAIFRGRF